MCLAIPGLIVQIDQPAGGDSLGRTARVSFGGMLREVSLAFVPDAAVGEYVIVHVGFALARVDETEARRVFEYLAAVGELGELGERDARDEPGMGRSPEREA